MLRCIRQPFDGLRSGLDGGIYFGHFCRYRGVASAVNWMWTFSDSAWITPVTFKTKWGGLQNRQRVGKRPGSAVVGVKDFTNMVPADGGVCFMWTWQMNEADLKIAIGMSRRLLWIVIDVMWWLWAGFVRCAKMFRSLMSYMCHGNRCWLDQYAGRLV